MENKINANATVNAISNNENLAFSKTDLWKRDVQPFYEEAEQVVSNLLETSGFATVEEMEANKTVKAFYPTVYFARKKNGRHGVTLPPVFDKGASAIDTPIECNTLVWAIAFAKKVESLRRQGNYTYYEWCRKYGYLTHGCSRWDSGAEYVRHNQTGDGYDVYVPVTGKGYDLVPYSKEQQSFDTFESAVFRRNQKLWSILKYGKDRAGEVPADRLQKYRRILTKGYFQAVCVGGDFRTQLVSALKNAVKYIDGDDTLKRNMYFYVSLFEGKLSEKSGQLKAAKYIEKSLVEYFRAIEMSDEFVKRFTNLSQLELRKFRPVRPAQSNWDEKKLATAVERLNQKWGGLSSKKRK